MSYYYNGNVYTCDEGRMMGESGDNTFLLGNVNSDTYDEMVGKNTCKATCAASVVESLPNVATVYIIHIAEYVPLWRIQVQEISSQRNHLTLDAGI